MTWPERPSTATPPWRRWLRNEQNERDPEAELEELVQIYVAKGLSPGLARQVATELMEHDALAAHVAEDLDVDDEDFLPAARLAVAVGLAFAAGAALPILSAEPHAAVTRAASRWRARRQPSAS